MKAFKTIIDKIEELESRRKALTIQLAAVNKDDMVYIQTNVSGYTKFDRNYIEIIIDFIQKHIDNVDDELNPMKEKLELLEKLL